MRKLTALLLSVLLLLTGCGHSLLQLSDAKKSSEKTESEKQNGEEIEDDYTGPQYDSLDDEKLLAHVEDLVYQDTVTSLNSEKFVVENVSAIYMSKEYLEEVASNSQSNVYFGYTLAELDELFQGTRYIFTLGDDGSTTVKELEEIEDTSTETMLKNVAIGTGVILVCVTVSTVTAGVGAPAVSMIFAASATTAKSFAVSSAIFGGVSAGVVRGIETGDFHEAMEAAAMRATEGFKWGAISGAISGAGKEAFGLMKATKGGLTMNQAARIQKESNLPMEVISQLHSVEEYAVYKEAGLNTMMIDGRTALVQNIDLNYVSTLADGNKITNLGRMQRGMCPLDPASGKAYELHHVGQNNDGVLAILTQEQHRGEGNFAKLHKIWNDSGVDHGSAWNKKVSDFWKAYASQYANGGV